MWSGHGQRGCDTDDPIVRDVVIQHARVRRTLRGDIQAQRDPRVGISQHLLILRLGQHLAEPSDNENRAPLDPRSGILPLLIELGLDWIWN